MSYGPRNELGEPRESETDPSPMGNMLDQFDPFSSPATSQSSTQELECPETRARRLRELRLLYQFTEKTCYTLDATGTSGLELWRDAVIRMAFSSDAMLYSLLALSAQHKVDIDPCDSEARAASMQYLSLALPLHRRDVAELNKVNADLAFLTGSLLRISSFATLQSRPIEPYTPPAQFLLQSRGSFDVLRIAHDWGYDDDPNSVISKMIDRAPYVRYWNRPTLFSEANRQPLLHLLYRSAEHLASEPWSGEIQSAYGDTLSYLGAVQSSKPSKNTGTPDTEGSQLDPPLRRLVLFPTMVPEIFIQLVIEAKPRALVILAHYFAALAEFEHVWWVSKIGIREIRGLLTAVKEFRWEGEIVTKLLCCLGTSMGNE